MNKQNYIPGTNIGLFTPEMVKERQRKADLTNALIAGIGLGFVVGIIVGKFIA